MSRYVVVALLLLAALSSGCAAFALTLLSAGAGTAASSGISYTLDSIAYKTFTASEEGLRTATLRTLKRMEIKVKGTERTEAGSKILAEASDRTIAIELDRLSGRTSRMRVDAKQGWFFKDRATAMEIILQTEQTLEDEPALARRATPAAVVRPPAVAGRKVAPVPQQTLPPRTATENSAH